MGSDVAAIVKHDVHATHLLHHRSEERLICLRTDPDVQVISTSLCAARVDIDAEDHGVFSKVLSP